MDCSYGSCVTLLSEWVEMLSWRCYLLLYSISERPFPVHGPMYTGGVPIVQSLPRRFCIAFSRASHSFKASTVVTPVIGSPGPENVYVGM